ncbi:HEAT repeat domain-containing protein [Nocardia sp. CA-107356]|uniref:HEAT repeat domain-containing protein n=1 Tax=Nocardia sp. CA-107356 TaxID=3239972 RepID=UPI003D94AA4F
MIIKYARMPYGSENGGTEWMNDLPARYKDGERGFDRRIMQDLAAVGVPCYTLGDLSNGPRTIPQGIPIFIDWLANLETRIPGPETEHRSAIRSGLIRNLIDPAARGNQEAIDLLIAQVRRQPPIPERMQTWACDALHLIAGPKNFVQIAELLEELPEGTAMIPLVEYLGKVKSPEARDIALRYLDSPARGKAIKALVQMKATGVRHLIEPLVDDRAPAVRKQAQRALEKLSS